MKDMDDLSVPQKTEHPEPVPEGPFWRVEGSLLNLGAVRPVAFFTANAQSFSERWARRCAHAIAVLTRPFSYFAHRIFATRLLHMLLRGISRDRLDLLAEEYFQYILKPRLKKQGVEKLKEWMAENGQVILVSQGLDHIMRPLAQHLDVRYLVANRLEFRDGLATGRLLSPVIPPRRSLARLVGRRPDGRTETSWILRELRIKNQPSVLRHAIKLAERPTPSQKPHSIVLADPARKVNALSVRESLSGKHILLIGVTGFIGKVWLIHLLNNIPEIGRIYLLIRRQVRNTALQRFEKIVQDSPAFDQLFERYGDQTAQFLSERIDVVEGDVSRPDLGLLPEVKAPLLKNLDVILNCAGLTDFNPDLREALAINVDSVSHILAFQRQCDRAAMLHLSTAYVVGSRDGRVAELETPDYTPLHIPGFDSEKELQALHRVVKEAEELSQSPAVTAELKKQLGQKKTLKQNLDEAALENQLRKQRARWLRSHLIQAGVRRAKELGWPNTYTLTKSLGESVIARQGADLPVAVVRPSIVETSLEEPFRGWNEGINTSAPLSYLLGTYFRQLPTNERKFLDLIPVDLVCRGMSLITAALISRKHHHVYHLATSASNPCDMRRSIELTGLAHRKFYRAQEGFDSWLLLRFDTIPVSKKRYQYFSAPRQQALIRAIQKTTPLLPFLKPPFAKQKRTLDRVEKIIELYEPFILHNEHVFEAENVELLSYALPENEKNAFGYNPRSVDWWDYWINIHIPAQRRWSYPLIEGRPLEPREQRLFQMQTPPVASPGESPQSG